MVRLWIDIEDERGLVDVVVLEVVPRGWYPGAAAHDRYGDPALLVHANTEALSAGRTATGRRLLDTETFPAPNGSWPALRGRPYRPPEPSQFLRWWRVGGFAGATSGVSRIPVAAPVPLPLSGDWLV